jgi:hypothetical protein
MTKMASRTRLHINQDSIQAVIPAPRHAWMLFLLPLWLGGWLPAGWSVARELTWPGDAADVGPLLFQLAWLAMSFIGSLWLFGMLLWSAFGVERISFARDHVALVREFACFKLYSLYRPAEISAVRVCRSMHFAVAGSAEAEYCKLAFDYRRRTVRFGCGIDESDAFRLVHEIHARAPWLAIL